MLHTCVAILCDPSINAVGVSVNSARLPGFQQNKYGILEYMDKCMNMHYGY